MYKASHTFPPLDQHVADRSEDHDAEEQDDRSAQPDRGLAFVQQPGGSAQLFLARTRALRGQARVPGDPVMNGPLARVTLSGQRAGCASARSHRK
jgi:hypothetical protein